MNGEKNHQIYSSNNSLRRKIIIRNNEMQCYIIKENDEKTQIILMLKEMK